MKEINVLDPCGELLEKPKTLAPRVRSLKGKVVGIISSGSGNSTEFLLRVSELLREKYGVVDTPMAIKPSVSVPLPEAQAKALRERADVVIAGVGVGGSNALSLVVDAINAELAGKPGVVVVGIPFERVTQAKIRNMAFPSLDYVVVPCPMGTSEEARAKGEIALQDIVNVATKGRR